MKMRKFVFGGLAGLLFMTFTALNLTVSQAYQGDRATVQLTLTELSAKADGGDEDPGGGGCTWSQTCSGGICSVLNAKKRFFNGCKKKCDYTCTVQGIPDIIP